MSPRRDRATLWLWMACLAASVGLVAAAAPASHAARRQARRAVAHLQTIAQKASRLEALRAGTPEWGSRANDRDALTTRLSAAIASCGLGADTLASVTSDPESMRQASRARIVTRRTSVVLSRLTLPALGRFLAAWRDRAPEWTITSIEIAPDAGRPPTPGADLPLRASIVMETTRVRGPDGPES